MEQEASRLQEKKCSQCAATLRYQPGTMSLVCEYCSALNEIEKAETQVVESDFLSTLESLEADQPVQEKLLVHCDDCGANIQKAANVTSSDCPYCGNHLVATTQTKKQIQPSYLLPFSIDQKAAFSEFKKWINSRWFAPNSLKRLAKIEGRLRGQYVPYWTYDSNTSSDYTGMRGDYYYVTRTRTVVRDGKAKTETYQERRTRWTPASGRVSDNFDDVLVVASPALPSKYVDELEPWDLKDLVAYSDDFLAGFGSESYQTDVKDGFQTAKKKMASVIRSHIRSDIGGDTQRIHSVNTTYDDISFKHILLPMWLSVYRYKEKIYRILINARTGEVQGERPWSWVKITLASILGLLIFVGIFAWLVESGIIEL